MAATKNGSMKPRWGIGLVVLIVVGVFGSDGVRTGLVKSSVSDDASQIAHDSANTYHSDHDINATYAAAEAEAASKGATIPSTNDFSVDGSGTVSLVLAKTNQTLVLGQLNSSWKKFSASATSTWAP